MIMEHAVDQRISSILTYILTYILHYPITYCHPLSNILLNLLPFSTSVPSPALYSTSLRFSHPLLYPIPLTLCPVPLFQHEK